MKTAAKGKGSESLGDRMKGYERAFRTSLPRRLPVIIRVDGKAFHTVTKGCVKPFDEKLMSLMDRVGVQLCEEAQGAVFAYVQSDEVSLLLHNYQRLSSDPWFDNELQKLVSVSASIAAATFTRGWGSAIAFDARAFVLPEKEVCNYFLWRQKDAKRNSIQMATRAVYSHAQVDDKNTTEMQEMLQAKGINWSDYPVGCRQGRAIVRHVGPGQGQDREGRPITVERSEWKVEAPPLFAEDRDYVNRRLAVIDESASA